MTNLQVSDNLLSSDNASYRPVDEPNNHCIPLKPRDVWIIKVRGDSHLPDAECASFHGGRPNNFPAEVTTLLWGGLSGYRQELEKKIHREFNVPSLLGFSLFWVLMIFLSSVGEESSSEWKSHMWVIYFFLVFSFSHVARFWMNHRFDREMNMIVDEKLAPVFRSVANCELRYVVVRSWWRESHSFFSIRKLNDAEKIDCQSNSIPSLDDEIYYPSWSSGPLPPVVELPVLGAGLRIPVLLLGKDSRTFGNMFVWGSLLECLQKVEKPYREKLIAVRTRQLFLLRMFLFFSFAVFIWWLLYFAKSDQAALVGTFVFIAIILITPVAIILAWKNDSYPSPDVLNREYSAAVEEVAPLIAENSKYTIEYAVTDTQSGGGAVLMFRLKPDHAEAGNTIV